MESCFLLLDRSLHAAIHAFASSRFCSGVVVQMMGSTRLTGISSPYSDNDPPLGELAEGALPLLDRHAWIQALASARFWAGGLVLRAARDSQPQRRRGSIQALHAARTKQGGPHLTMGSIRFLGMGTPYSDRCSPPPNSDEKGLL